jgi:hypothetical protein
MLLNALKYLAGINDKVLLLPPNLIEPIQELKTTHLGGHNPRLHTDEILIALSISAVTNPIARLALDHLSFLKGAECHSTVILSQVDVNVLKKLGINCELALEFAKDKVWEESIKILDDQLYVFGKQYHKLFRLNGKVDVIITDSPLLISILYNKTPSEYFDKLVVEQYHTFNNLLFFINRAENYQTEGRLQTKDESMVLDYTMKHILLTNDIEYDEVSCENAVDYIVDIVKTKLNI